MAAGAGTASKLQPFIADLAQKISWGSFVCIGLAFGKVAAELRFQVTGLMGFPAAPVDFNVARATHKVTENALGLASGVPALGPSPDLLAGIKALEYAALGLILVGSFMTVGLGAGVMAIGYIALIQSTAPRDHQTAVAKVIAPPPVIVAPPPVALARPKVMPAKPRAAPAAKNPTAGRTADARAQPDSHAHPYAGTGEIVA